MNDLVPQRLQLSRKRFFNLQEASLQLNGLEVVNVTRLSKWGSPYRIGPDGNRDEVVKKFKELALGHAAAVPFFPAKHPYPSLEAIRAELAGFNLGCTCPVWACSNPEEEHHFSHTFTPPSTLVCPKCGAALARVPCHADVLLEVANS